MERNAKAKIVDTDGGKPSWRVIGAHGKVARVDIDVSEALGGLTEMLEAVLSELQIIRCHMAAITGRDFDADNIDEG